MLADIEARRRAVEQQLLQVSSADKPFEETTKYQHTQPFETPQPSQLARTDQLYQTNVPEHDLEAAYKGPPGRKTVPEDSRFEMPGQPTAPQPIREASSSRPITEPVSTQPGLSQPITGLGTTHEQRMARFETPVYQTRPGAAQYQPQPRLETSQKPIHIYPPPSSTLQPTQGDRSSLGCQVDEDRIRAYQQRLLSRPGNGPEQIRQARLELERKAEELLRVANEEYLAGEAPRISNLGQFHDVDTDKSPSDTDPYYSRQSLGSSTRQSHGSRPSGETQYLSLPTDLNRILESYEGQRSYMEQRSVPRDPNQDDLDRTLTEDEQAEFPRTRSEFAPTRSDFRPPPPSYSDVSADSERYEETKRLIQPGEDTNTRPLTTLVPQQYPEQYPKQYSQQYPLSSITMQRDRDVVPTERTPEKRVDFRSQRSPQASPKRQSPTIFSPVRSSPKRRSSPSPKRASPKSLSPHRASLSSEDNRQRVYLHEQLAAIRKEKEEILARQARQREEMEAMRQQWQHSLKSDSYMLDVSQRVEELHQQTPGKIDTTTSDEPTPIDLLNPNYIPENELTPTNSPQRRKEQSPKYFSSASGASKSPKSGEDSGKISGEVQVYSPAEARYLESVDKGHDDSYEPHELSTIKEDDTPQDESELTHRSRQSSQRDDSELSRQDGSQHSSKLGDLPLDENAQFRLLHSEERTQEEQRYSLKSQDEAYEQSQFHLQHLQTFQTDQIQPRDGRRSPQLRSNNGYYTVGSDKQPLKDHESQSKVYESLDDFHSAYQPAEAGITISSSDEKSREESYLSEGANLSGGISEGASSNTGEFRPSRDWTKELAQYSDDKQGQEGELGNLEDRLRDVYEALRRAATSKALDKSQTQGPVDYQELSTSKSYGDKTEAWPQSPEDRTRTRISTGSDAVSAGLHPVSSSSQSHTTDTQPFSTGMRSSTEEETRGRSARLSSESAPARESVGSFHPLALEDTMSEYRRRRSQSPVMHRSSVPLDSSTPAKQTASQKAVRRSVDDRSLPIDSSTPAKQTPTSQANDSPVQKDVSPIYKPFERRENDTPPPSTGSGTQTQFVSTQQPFADYKPFGTAQDENSELSQHTMSNDPFSPDNRLSLGSRKSDIPSLSQYPIESSNEGEISPRSDTNSQKSTELSQYPASESSSRNGPSAASLTGEIIFHGNGSNDATRSFQSFKSSKLENESPLFSSTYDSAKIQAHFEAMAQKAFGSGGFDTKATNDQARGTAIEDYNAALRTPDKKILTATDRKSPSVRFASHTDVHQMSSQSSGSEQQHQQRDGPGGGVSGTVYSC